MTRAALVAAALLLAAPGCFAEEPTSSTPASPTPALNRTAPTGPFAISSPAFQNGQPIPNEYSCDGTSGSPPLNVVNVPLNATHWALIMQDPDAGGGTRTVLHWTFWDLDWTDVDLPKGVSIADKGGREGQKYRGPCPPNLDPPHHYSFYAFALDAPIELRDGASLDSMKAAMQGHVAAQAVTMGTFQRPQIPPF